MTEQNQVWRLELGVHRGTMMSRDFHSTKTHFDSDKLLLSLKDCQETANKWEQNYHSLGLFIWYGTAYSPDNKPTQVLSGVSYR